MTPIRCGDWHVVGQGESIDSIAAQVGHRPETVWDAQENRELKEKRKDPHVLHPGDRLFVPPVKPKTASVQTGKASRVTFARPAARLKLQLVVHGKPRAGEPFRLLIDGVETTGKTDGHGFIDQPIPVLARKAVLTVGEGEQATTHDLLLRTLDPVAEPSGAQARLRNLGYGEVPLDGALGPPTVAALCAFQRDQGLEVTGKLDRATQDKLVEAHGS